MPIFFMSASTFSRTTCMILSRSPEITSCTVRLLNSSWRAAFTVWPSWIWARVSSP